MKKKYLWIGGGAVIIAVAAGFTMLGGKKEELQEVQTAHVERQKIVQKVISQN